jgi:hypothetical protein
LKSNNVSYSQGYLDSLCSIYTIINAERLINGTGYSECYGIFREIMTFINKKKILLDVCLDGMNHKIFSSIMQDVMAERIPFQESNKRSFSSIDEWWEYSSDFIKEPRRAIIISALEKESKMLGFSSDSWKLVELSTENKDGHYTVAHKITKSKLYLVDSNWRKKYKRQDCGLALSGSDVEIWATQCWYLGAK